MDTSKNYYETMMRDFATYGRGRSLEQYCRDEAVDYKWLIKAQEKYGLPDKSSEMKPVKKTKIKTPDMIQLHFDPENDHADEAKEKTMEPIESPAEESVCGGKNQAEWSVTSLWLKTPSILHYSSSGYEMYVKWFDDGKALKPEFSKMTTTRTITRSQLLLLLNAASKTKLKIA